MAAPHILLIEDDPMVRDAIREHLVFRGYTCTEAGNGAEALQILQTLSPDLILSDISMPVMGGIEFLMKSRALGSRVPIIFLTGVNDSTVRTLGKDVGAFECVSKPPDYDHLDHLIKSSIAVNR